MPGPLPVLLLFLALVLLVLLRSGAVRAVDQPLRLIGWDEAENEENEDEKEEERAKMK